MSGSSSPDEDCVRRSSRKRRSPGEWWQEFPAEKRAPLDPISSDEAKSRKALRLIEDQKTSTVQTSNDNSNTTEEPLRTVYVTDEDGEVDDGFPSHEEEFQQTCPSEVTKRTAEIVPTPCVSKAGRSAEKTSQTKAYRVNSNDNAVLLDNEVESDSHDEFAAPLTVDVNVADNSSAYLSPASQRRSISSVPTVILPNRGSRDPTPTELSSRTGNVVVLSDDSTQEDHSHCHPPFGKEKAQDSGTVSQLTSQQDEGLRADVRTQQSQDGDNCNDNHEQKKRQAKPSQLSSRRVQQKHHKLWGADGSKERPISSKRFSRSQLHDSLNDSNVRPPDETPPASRRLTAAGFADELNLQSKELSKLKAPRKSRATSASPCYSFSLRSRLEPQPFSTPMTKPSENAQIDETMEESTYTRQGILVARKTALRYNIVTGPSGTVKVAISISLNKCTVGEVVILPRSTTGPRRALTGDEFYIVKQGYVQCDVGSTSVTLSGGDHLGIPEGQCFEIRNPSSSRCELFFFSPRNFNTYSRIY